MKKANIILLFLVLIINSTNIFSQISKGSGIVKEDVRDLKGFTEIIAQGKFRLFLVQGDTEEVKIVTDDNLNKYFQTRMDGEVLHINMNADIRKYKELNVYVSIKSLKKITLLNEVFLESTNVLQFDELTLLAGDMSRIEIEIFASKVDLGLTDGTYVYIKGYSERLNMEVHDETELNAFDLQSDYCNVKSSGLTEIMINVEKDLKLFVTGSSNVYYTGVPKISKRIFTSSGFIVKRKKETIGEANGLN